MIEEREDDRVSAETEGQPSGDGLEVSAEQVKDGFGEELRQTLDLETWHAGEDLAKTYGRLEAEVQAAVRHEDSFRKHIRAQVLPHLAGYPGAPKGAGVYQAHGGDLQRIHRDLLFSGRVEACDGLRQTYDSLPVTVHQIGVSLVSYQGNQGSWGHRLFRRDLRVSGGDPVAEMTELLERREARGRLDGHTTRDTLSQLAGRGIMSYAERSILLQRSAAAWRMGHGNPAPFELITGSGSTDLMVEATKVIRALVEGHQKFVFVGNEPSDKLLLTIGQALRPLEFAIVRSLKELIEETIERGSYRTRLTVDATWDGETLKADQWIRRFRDVVAPQVVVGVYRATRLAPPQLFFAHRDHADLAAHIALADSIFQEHRGFPLLIDLADTVCRGVFGGDSLGDQVAAAYAGTDAPFRYQ